MIGGWWLGTGGMDASKFTGRQPNNALSEIKLDRGTVSAVLSNAHVVNLRMETMCKPSTLWYIKHGILMLWALPTVIVGAALSIIYYWPHSFAWRHGVLVCTARRMPRSFIAVTFGWLCIYDERWRDVTPIVEHEERHTRDALVWGPLFLPAYAACFVYEFLYHHDFMIAYAENWFERRANLR